MTRQSPHTGFTLIELIVVIVILGILGIAVAPRFQGPDGYTEYAAQTRLIAALRQMQVRAMHDARTAYCHQIVFDTDSSPPQFGVAIADFAQANATASCQSSILPTAAMSFTLDKGLSMSAQDGSTTISSLGFNHLGQALSSSGQCLAGCQIDFSGESTVSVCVNQEGYIRAC